MYDSFCDCYDASSEYASDTQCIDNCSELGQEGQCDEECEFQDQEGDEHDNEAAEDVAVEETGAGEVTSLFYFIY